MSGDDPRLRRLLRWYPEAWVARYGEEFVALMSDQLAGRAPSVSFRARVATSGVVERGRGAGLIGADSPERRRAGLWLVVVAWSAMVVAGAGFAKTTEHFSSAVGPLRRWAPVDIYRGIVALGLLGTATLVAGVLLATPALVTFLRAGGWPSVRRGVARALVATTGAATATVALALWAHHRTAPQRNGADHAYAVAFAAWIVIVVAAVATWTWAGLALARRLSLSGRTLRLESRLALALVGVMLALGGAFALWWWAMAGVAPSFLAGVPAPSGGGGGNLNLLAVGALIGFVEFVAAWGATRIVGARGPREGVVRT